MEKLEEFLQDGQVQLIKKPNTSDESTVNNEESKAHGAPEPKLNTLGKEPNQEKTASSTKTLSKHQAKDPDIESRQTDVTSSSDDLDSIESPPIGKKANPRSHKPTTAINTAETKNEVTITIGGEQTIHAIGSMGEHSVMHVRMWNRYLSWLKRKGKKHGGYERFRTMARDKKQAYSRIIEMAGKAYQCFGPFLTTIQLDGLEMRIPMFITTDDDYGAKLSLGDDVWKPRKIAAITGCLDRSQVDYPTIEHPINENSRTELQVRGMRFNVLVDTGAGPSCMARHVYTALGGKIEDLYQVGGRLTAANASQLQVHGLSDKIQFSIQEHEIDMRFFIVENLGADEIILGRDFLKDYDVLVDVPNNKIEIRNPNKTYAIKTIHRINRQLPIYVGKSTKDTLIEGGDMIKCEYTVSARHNRDTDSENNWLAIVEPVYTNRLDDEGLRIASSVSTISYEKCEVAVLNANTDTAAAKSLKSKDSKVRLRPIWVDYERVSRTDEQVDNPQNKITIIDIRATKRPDEATLFEDHRSVFTGLSLKSHDATLSSRTNFPIETKGMAKPFPTKPQIDQLQQRLTDDQWTDLNEMLDKHNAIFSRNASDIGTTDVVTHTIEIEEGAVPFKEQVRRLGPDKKLIADEQVQTLIEMGVIRPSRSPYASAIVLVKKSDGSSRFCIDFRKLNDITIKDSFPLPVIADHMDKLGAARYFTSLDMGSAFWQVKLDDASMPKTAFITADNQYEWTRMPFGLCNATATFQRLMTKTIGQISSRYGNLVLCYVDDILIATNTVEQHIERLDEVFTCLKAAGLKLKAAKCKLMETHVKFLGRVVSEEGIQPDIADVEKIRNWETPDSKTKLESFIGFANYYREFIKNFADIVSPLNKYKGKNQEFGWDDDAQEAFDKLKLALTTAPVLALPDEEGHFVLDTDASRVAISGILHQWQTINGKDKLVVINYASRGLKGSERKYSAAKSEMLAALTFIEHNRKWLLGREFTIRVDNQAFSWLKTYSTKSEHVGRWIVRLDGFNMRIQHRTRNHHTNADGLSKKTEYYGRADEREIPEHVAGFSFMSQEQFDELPLIEIPIKEPKKTVEDLELQKNSQQAAPPELESPQVVNLGHNIPYNEKVITTDEEFINAIRDELRENSIPKEMQTQLEQDALTSVAAGIEEIRYNPDKDTDSQYSMPEGFETEAVPCPELTHDDLWTPRHRRDIEAAWKLSVSMIKFKKKYNSTELVRAQNADMLLRNIRELLCRLDPADRKLIWARLSEQEKKWFNKNKADLKINKVGILGHLTRYQNGTEIAWTIVMPAKYQFEILRAAHDLNGHCGINKTKDEIRKEFSWPGLDAEIELFVKSCRRCQLGKGQSANKKGKLKSIKSYGINDLVECDFENLCVSTEGHKGLLVVIDHWSKYLKVFPLKEFTAQAACEALFDGWIHPFGAPKRILTDQGSQFESVLFKEMLRVFGIVKSHGTAYHPQTQGLVERSNQTITKMLRCCARLDQRLWHKQVQAVASVYNQTIHSTIKVSPNEVFLCRRTNSPLSWFFPKFCEEQGKGTLPEWLEEQLKKMQEIAKVVTKNAQQGAVRQAEQHNKKAIKLPLLKVGEYAFVFSKSIPKNKVKKLHVQWNGPVKCTGVFNDGLNYTFDKVKGNKMAHMAMVKPYLPRPGETRLEPFTGELDLLGDEDGITIIYPLGGDESIIQADDTPYADDLIDGPEINENYIGPDNNPVVYAEAEAPTVTNMTRVRNQARSLWSHVTRRGRRKPPEIDEGSTGKQETLDNQSVHETVETAVHSSPPRVRRTGLRDRNKLTKRVNGEFVKRTRHDRHEIYNESGGESEEPNSEDERLTVQLRDIIAKPGKKPQARIPPIPSDIDSEFEEITIADEHAPIGDSIILPDEYAAGAAPNDFGSGEGDSMETETIDTEGLSRRSCGIVARKFGREQQEIPEEDKGSEVHKERIEIELDHPTGQPRIEPPLQFGHAFVKEHGQRIKDQGMSERANSHDLTTTTNETGRGSQNQATTNETGRGSQHSTNSKEHTFNSSVAHEGADDDILSLAEIPQDDEDDSSESTKSSESMEHVRVVNDKTITISTRDILDTGGDIVIDISADLETGNGIRKDIAREHGGLDQYFQLRKEPGEVLVIDPYSMPQGQTIYYIISRTRFHDPFNLPYYVQGLRQVREIAKSSGTSCLYTVKVPFVKDGCAGTDVRDALIEAFSDTGIHVRLCVQPT